MVWKEVDHLRGMTLPCCGIYKYRDHLHRGMGATVVLSWDLDPGVSWGSLE